MAVEIPSQTFHLQQSPVHNTDKVCCSHLRIKKEKSQNTKKVPNRSLILQWYKLEPVLGLSLVLRNLAFNLKEEGNLIFSHPSAVKMSAATS